MKFLTFLLLLLSVNISSQCTMACYSSVSVDMNINCEYLVIESDLLEPSGTNCPASNFVIEIIDNGTTIPTSPTIGASYEGQTLDFIITDLNSSNSCFGTITANDGSAPMMTCQADHTLNLDLNGQAILQPSDIVAFVDDNCDSNPVLTLSQNTFTCNDVAIPQTVFIIATDIAGNSSSCFTSVTIADVSPPSVTCIATLTLNMNASNNIILNPADILDSSSDNCSVNLTVSQATFDCSNLGSNFVTLTASDDSGNSSSCFTNVEITDTNGFCIPPSLIITGNLNTSQTFQATNFIQFDATVIPGVYIILLAPEVFTVNGCEVQLGGELEINP